MEAERRSSKGGFLQLFDWNSKSRKKLFSNKSGLADTELSKQGKQNVAKSLDYLQFMEVREDGQGLTSKRNDEYITSSMATDDGFGTKAPGVVARLMGLDCLPTSAYSETNSSQYYDPSSSSNSFTHTGRSNFKYDYEDLNKIPSVNGPRNLVDQRLQKVQNRAIDRFQSEILPPKSAKPIPIAHQHRMLSPIKNPAFILTKDLAYIVEASSKIMEQCPQSPLKGKTLHLASSSTPLRMRDVRERMNAVPKGSSHPETLRRPKEPVVSQNNGEPSRKKNYSANNTERETSGRLKEKGKSVSLAVQAKVGAQRRERLDSSDSRRSANRKEADEVKNGQHNQRRVYNRNAVSRSSGVLKQNIQKQNCANTREKLPGKASVPTHQNKKAQPVNGSVRLVKDSSTVLSSAVGFRKINTTPKETGKESTSSKSKQISVNKPIGCENVYFDDPISDNVTENKDHNKQIKCNITRDGCSNMGASERKSSTDVVSFTFTSPIKQPETVTGSSEKIMENGIRLHDDINYGPKNPTLYSPRSNVTHGDALSVLLEQKLKELTSRVESSHCHFDNPDSAASSFNVIDTTQDEECIDFEINMRRARSSEYHSPMLKANGKWKGLRENEEKSSENSYNIYRKECDPSFTSTLEPSSSDGSYDDSSDLNSIPVTKGNKRYHFIKPRDIVDCISDGMSQLLGADLEFSDSASSSSAACLSGSYYSPTVSLNEFQRSGNWELEYIIKILSSSDLNFDDLMLGHVTKVLNPNLFNQIENLQTLSSEYIKLERKVLFDCVGECLDSRGEHLFGGKCKEFLKWETIFQRKMLLAEDLCREISTWTGLEDLMVDELVDKDMSSGKGKWVDFENEGFEEGVEIEKAILSSLVDELVEALRQGSNSYQF